MSDLIWSKFSKKFHDIPCSKFSQCRFDFCCCWSDCHLQSGRKRLGPLTFYSTTVLLPWQHTYDVTAVVENKCSYIFIQISYIYFSCKSTLHFIQKMFIHFLTYSIHSSYIFLEFAITLFKSQNVHTFSIQFSYNSFTFFYPWMKFHTISYNSIQFYTFSSENTIFFHTFSYSYWHFHTSFIHFHTFHRLLCPIFYIFIHFSYIFIHFHTKVIHFSYIFIHSYIFHTFFIHLFR